MFDVIILAAGSGSRMQSSINKVMFSLGSFPILFHVLNTARSLQPNSIIVVTDGSIEIPGVNIVVQKNRLGTADAVRCAMHHVKSEYVLILYGDTPLIKLGTIKRICDLSVSSFEDVISLLAFVPNKSDHMYGILEIDSQNSEVICIHEYSEQRIPTSKFANSGVLATKKKVLLDLIPKVNQCSGEYRLTDIVSLPSDVKTRFILCDEHESIGINDKIDLARAEKYFQDLTRHKMLNKSVTLIDPNSIYFALDTNIAEEVTIHPNVFIGKGVTIGYGSTILPYCYLSGVSIGENCIIGPFANLTNDSQIYNGSTIGSFVNVKRSFIGENTKIKHLAYIGDATLGNNVNIGAGVVTCNYDGKNKNKTHINEGSFVGANSSIVAPIRLGRFCKIGAGSVITQNISDDCMSVERGNQSTHQIVNKKVDI